MSTRAVQNGKGTEIIWSTWAKITAGIVVGGALSTTAIAVQTWLDVQILQRDVAELREDLREHIKRPGIHEDADQKRGRIYDEIRKYHAIRPSIIEDDDPDASGTRRK